MNVQMVIMKILVVATHAVILILIVLNVNMMDQDVLFAHRDTSLMMVKPVVLRLVTLISSLMMDLYVLIVVNAQVVMQTMINVCLILLLLRIMGHCFQQELVRIRLNL